MIGQCSVVTDNFGRPSTAAEVRLPRRATGSPRSCGRAQYLAAAQASCTALDYAGLTAGDVSLGAPRHGPRSAELIHQMHDGRMPRWRMRSLRSPAEFSGGAEQLRDGLFNFHARPAGVVPSTSSWLRGKRAGTTRRAEFEGPRHARW